MTWTRSPREAILAALAPLFERVEQIEQDYAMLADAIQPSRASDPWWTTKNLAALASAHREDSETVDAVELRKADR